MPYLFDDPFWLDPQVPIGGCYRLIDIPMSNCINSGIRKIFILTQFNSFSLNRHLSRTYNFDNGIHFADGFVEVIFLVWYFSHTMKDVASYLLTSSASKQVLAATQTPGEAGKRWFQGTADAVRQFIWVFEVNCHIKFSKFHNWYVGFYLKFNGGFKLVSVGGQDQECGEYCDFVRRSSVQDGLHGLCAGESFFPHNFFVNFHFSTRYIWRILLLWPPYQYKYWSVSAEKKGSFLTLWLACLQKHIDTDADITVSCVPMDQRYLSRLFTAHWKDRIFCLYLYNFLGFLKLRSLHMSVSTDIVDSLQNFPLQH